MIEEHIKDCPLCRTHLERMREGVAEKGSRRALFIAKKLSESECVLDRSHSGELRLDIVGVLTLLTSTYRIERIMLAKKNHNHKTPRRLFAESLERRDLMASIPIQVSIENLALWRAAATPVWVGFHDGTFEIGREGRQRRISRD